MPYRSLADSTFLVADGSSFARQLVRNSLAGYGVRRFVDCADGDAVWRSITRERPAVALMDLDLPGGDAIKLTRRIRESVRALATLPVIILSSAATRDVVLRALRSGAHEFVTKPFAPATLYGRISQLLATPRPFIRTPGYFGPVPNAPVLVRELAGSGQAPYLVCAATGELAQPGVCTRAECICRAYDPDEDLVEL